MQDDWTLLHESDLKRQPISKENADKTTVPT
jgi:hypothetical protein